MEIEKINKAANILYNSRINLKRIKELPKDSIPESLEEADFGKLGTVNFIFKE